MTFDPSAEPKPCPQCGQVPHVIHTMFTSLPYVVCLACGIETQACSTPGEAIALWNADTYERRSSTSRPQATNPPASPQTTGD